MSRVLIVVTHPRADALVRAAADRAIDGARRGGHEVRVLDLDGLGAGGATTPPFDPVLTAVEKVAHISHTAADRPELTEHTAALQWAERVVLVYPTWFGGQPARLKGWFDRVWMNDVAWTLPEGSSRLRGRLGNVRKLHIITTHGSPRWVNMVQGNAGRLCVFRTLRVLCHPMCRTKWTALYALDGRRPDEIEQWLDRVAARMA